MTTWVFDKSTLCAVTEIMGCIGYLSYIITLVMSGTYEQFW